MPSSMLLLAFLAAVTSKAEVMEQIVDQRPAVIMVADSSTGDVEKNEMAPDAGFRGIPWGTKLSELPDMVKIGGERGVMLYSRKDDSLHIGAADLESIHYMFDESQLFYGVAFSSDGTSNNQNLLDALKHRFGDRWKQPNRFMEKFIWERDNARVLFSCDLGMSGTCFTLIISQAHIQDSQRRNSDAAKNSDADF